MVPIEMSAEELVSRIDKSIDTIAEKRERMGVVMYIPNSEVHARQFLAFLFASWRYMVDNEDMLFEKTPNDKRNLLDLLAFCHPNICKHIQDVCTLVSKRGAFYWRAALLGSHTTLWNRNPIFFSEFLHHV